MLGINEKAGMPGKEAAFIRPDNANFVCAPMHHGEGDVAVEKAACRFVMKPVSMIPALLNSVFNEDCRAIGDFSCAEPLGVP